MPNWCNNELTIIGDKAVLDRLVEFVKDEGEATDFSFDKIIPYPEPFHSMDTERLGGENGFNNGGHEWCIRNWGTKWDVSGVYGDRLSADRMLYAFDTAWSPPEPVVERLAGMFPELELLYHFEEPGECFAGDREYRDGCLVAENDYEPQYEDEHTEDDGESDEDEEAQASPGM